MATYYVRKNGSDANSTAQAQDPATAWLTIDKAANNVAAGDTVYVGAGTYRELVTMDTSGSSGSPISFIADITGENTGDPGLVVISAFTDSNTVTRASCWDPDGRTFITVRGFVMQGGSTAVVFSNNATNDNFEGCSFEDCCFVSGPAKADAGIYINMNAASTPATSGLAISRCTFLGMGVQIVFDGNETADQDLKIKIQNNVMVGNAYNNVANAGCSFTRVTSGSFNSGGVDVTNNLMTGLLYGVLVGNGTSTTYPVQVSNNVISANTALNKLVSNDGALASSYNTMLGSVVNVTAGTGDRNESSIWMLGGITDQPLYTFLGWSPYAPFEPMRPNTDDDWTSLIGDANATDAPADDLYGNPRPMHGTADDRGPVEGRARPEQETTTVRTGSNAARFEGSGFHDILVPVAAESTTITVYARKDSNYTGTAPQLKILNIPGVSDITDTHSTAANTWDQLTSGAFTPTSAGVCRVRLISNDTSATGQSFFDDLELA